jgi:hypothetical protein
MISTHAKILKEYIASAFRDLTTQKAEAVHASVDPYVNKIDRIEASLLLVHDRLELLEVQLTENIRLSEIRRRKKGVEVVTMPVSDPQTDDTPFLS